MTRARFTLACLGAVVLSAVVIITFVSVSDRTSERVVASGESTEGPAMEFESELASTAAIAMAAAPSTTTSTTTTSSTSTSTTTTSTTTTTVPPTLPLSTPEPVQQRSTECRGERFEVQIPIGWYEQACAAFSEGPFPAVDAIGEFRPEIELTISTSQSYPEVIGRISTSQEVLSSVPTTVNGRVGRRYVLRDESEGGERTVVVIDGGDAVLFVTANQLVAIDAPNQLGIEARYTRTLATFDDLLAEIIIDPASNQLCVDPTFSNPEIVKFGRADLDGDGDIERLRLIIHDDGRAITIDGLSQGTVWGPIPDGVNPSQELAWADWDDDSSPEVIYSLARNGAAAAHGVLTVQNCALTTVVDSDGQALELVSFALDGEARNGYACVRDEILGFALQGSQSRVIDDQSDPTHTVTRYLYRTGVVTLDGQGETETRIDFGSGGGLDSCVERRF